MILSIHALLANEKYGQAFELITDVLMKYPFWEHGWKYLGVVPFSRFRSRLKTFANALLEAFPTDEGVPYLIGQYYFKQDAFQESADYSALVVERNPQRTVGWRFLATILTLLEKEVDAVHANLQAYRLEPSEEITRQCLFLLLTKKRVFLDVGFQRTELLNQALVDLMGDSKLEGQGLAPLACDIVADLLEASNASPPEVFDDINLVHTCLRRAINVNLRLENLLVPQRQRFLKALAEGTTTATHYRFAVSLALACFNNEFIWGETPEETERVKDLGAQLEGPINEALIWPLLVYSMFRPLYQHSHAQTLANFRHSSPDLTLLLRRCLTEPLLERTLAPSIPTLTPIEDATSQRVRQMYEESCYPRWVHASGMYQDIKENIGEVLGEEPPAFKKESLKVLDAGCGTGQHAVHLAMGNPKAQITAIDLSPTSLAYGVRKQRELKLKNLHFGQADILEFGQTGQTYHHIESMSVLHHLADPFAGWSVLRGLLKPGGTMRIGLYSALGRTAMVQEHSSIVAKGLLDFENIIPYRNNFIHEPEIHFLMQGNTHVEYFTTSALREFLFHVQEQCYDLARLSQELQQLGLNFLGFELPKEKREAFADQNPQAESWVDLGKWETFERSHPTTFENMYIFWVQAPESS